MSTKNQKTTIISKQCKQKKITQSENKSCIQNLCAKECIKTKNSNMLQSMENIKYMQF